MAEKKYQINIVCGAPGTGKSTLVEACTNAKLSFTALDIDWLLESTNTLMSLEAQIDIRHLSKAWPAYNALWFEVMHSILRNGGQPVLFAPIIASDIQVLPSWCGSVNWFFLDCSDQTLTQRLNQRSLSNQEIAEVHADAQVIRDIISSTPDVDTSDTGHTTPQELARSIESWLALRSNKIHEGTLR